MASPQTILVVDEDEICRSFLADNLGDDGYHVMSAETREHALALWRAGRRTSSWPTSTGRPWACSTRSAAPAGCGTASTRSVPLLVFSARADELARVRALERGADDVLAKPFSYPELRARIRAVIRRCTNDPDTCSAPAA